MAETIVDKECAEKASLFETARTIRQQILMCDRIAEYAYDAQSELGGILKSILLNGELPAGYEKAFESANLAQIYRMIDVIESSDEEVCDEW